MMIFNIKEFRKLSYKKILVLSLSIIAILTLLYPQQIMISVNPIIRVIENQILLYRIRDYKEFQTENFIIKYNNIDAEMLQMVADTAEDKYEALTRIFNYQPKKKVTMIVHNNPSRMMSVTMLKKGTPPMGVYYADTIHVLDPKQLFQEDIEEKFYSEGPVLHELAHLFTDNISGGNYPIWFTEGVSLYLEYAVDGYVWGDGEVIDNEEYNINSLTNSFSHLNQYLAYTQSFRLVKGFVDQYGEEELIRLINKLGNGEEISNYQHMFQKESTIK